MFDYTNDSKYIVKEVLSRRVIDFSDIENSWGILPTGQSGNPLSAHYSDQAEIYNAGNFRKMMLNKRNY
jgi:penicillin amidase